MADDHEFHVQGFKDHAQTLSKEIGLTRKQLAGLSSQIERLEKRENYLAHQLAIVTVWDATTAFAYENRTGRRLDLDERASKEDQHDAIEIFNSNSRVPIPQTLADMIAQVKKEKS